MTEVVPGATATPDPANLQPLTPEAQLKANLTQLVDGALAHYAGQPERPRIDRTTPGRVETTMYDHRDGAHREVITWEGGAETRRVDLPHGIVDQSGRRALLMATENPDGSTVYDMRLLGGRAPAAIYRWSAGEPVALVSDRGESVAITADMKDVFGQASDSADRISSRWHQQVENQSPEPSSRALRLVTRAAHMLTGAVVSGFRTRYR